MHLPWISAQLRNSGPGILTSVTGPESEALASLAAGAADIVEVGAAYGYSSVLLALAGLPHVTSIDPHQWIAGSFEAQQANLAAYGVTDRVTVMRESSAVALARLIESDQWFDLAFIDGDHSYEAVMADVLTAIQLLRPGGVLACHDYGEDCCCEGVRRALDLLFPDGPTRLAGSLFIVEAPDSGHIEMAPMLGAAVGA